VNEQCELCQGDDIMGIIHQDDVCWITRCKIHKVPMIVLNDHKDKPTEDEMKHMESLRQRYFPKLKFRGYMKSIPDHWHDHLI